MSLVVTLGKSQKIRQAMLKIRRLNMDSSWQLDWAGQSILIDPWLMGSEVDFTPAFNKQWHRTTPVNINSLSDYDAILISQHFSDHCHEETLKELDTKTILTTKKGARRLKKNLKLDSTFIIPTLASNNWLKIGSLEFCLLPALSKFSASFSGIIIRHLDTIIAYFPHGYTLSKKQQELLKPYKTILLITSFSTFKLPFYLGGYVNPGLQHAKRIIDCLEPKYLLATHDEDKHAEGIVKKIAKVTYPPTTELKKRYPNRFINLDLGATMTFED